MVRVLLIGMGAMAVATDLGALCYFDSVGKPAWGADSANGGNGCTDLNGYGIYAVGTTVTIVNNNSGGVGSVFGAVTTLAAAVDVGGLACLVDLVKGTTRVADYGVDTANTSHLGLVSLAE